MQVNSIQASCQKPRFQSKRDEYENPVSRGTEKNLAILSAVAGSAVTGSIVGGAAMFFAKEGKRGKMFAIASSIATGIMLAINLPAKLYNTKVNAFVKQKEMDVFTRDRELKSNLTEQVHDEVKDKQISLDKKLDDNLKLQMANRAAALGVANITPQA